MGLRGCALACLGQGEPAPRAHAPRRLGEGESKGGKAPPRCLGEDGLLPPSWPQPFLGGRGKAAPSPPLMHLYKGRGGRGGRTLCPGAPSSLQHLLLLLP